MAYRGAGKPPEKFGGGGGGFKNTKPTYYLSEKVTGKNGAELKLVRGLKINIEEKDRRVVTLDALESARVEPPTQHPTVFDYLRDDDPWALDLRLEVTLNGTVVSRPPFRTQYWTPGQQLAHLTVNGASLRTGDLFASGTVTGSARDERGSFLELSWGGQEPFTLDDGQQRTFLEDGDTVSITAWAPGADGVRIGFGAVTGTIATAH